MILLSICQYIWILFCLIVTTHIYFLIQVTSSITTTTTTTTTTTATTFTTNGSGSGGGISSNNKNNNINNNNVNNHTHYYDNDFFQPTTKSTTTTTKTRQRNNNNNNNNKLNKFELFEKVTTSGINTKSNGGYVRYNNNKEDDVDSQHNQRQQQQSNNEQQQIHHANTKTAQPLIPLNELIIQQNNVTTCLNDNNNDNDIIFPIMESIILNNDNTTTSSTSNNRIPKLIHIAIKTRCNIPIDVQQSLILNWKNMFDSTTTSKSKNEEENESEKYYSLIIHDEFSINKLLNQYYKEFPHLQSYMKCITTGKAKLNLWRFLVLWEYGGYYINWIDIAKYSNSDSNNSDYYDWPRIISNITQGNYYHHHDAILLYTTTNTTTSSSNNNNINNHQTTSTNNNNNINIYPHIMGSSSHHPIMHSAVLRTLSEILYMKQVGALVTDRQQQQQQQKTSFDSQNNYDVASTNSRMLLSDIVRVFLRKSFDHTNIKMTAFQALDVFEDGKIFTGIGNRKLTTIEIVPTQTSTQTSSTSTNEMIMNERTTTTTKRNLSLYELSNNPNFTTIGKTPKGQNHYDVCIQYLYKLDVMNHDIH